MDFTDWLRGQFDERGWTLGQAETYTGIDKSQLSLYLRHKASPSLKTIRKLAKAFEVTVESIEGRIDAERPAPKLTEPSPLSLFGATLAPTLQRMARITEWMVERNVSAEEADAILERLYQELRRGA